LNQFCAECGAELRRTMFTVGVVFTLILIGLFMLSGIGIAIAYISDPKSFNAPQPSVAAADSKSTPQAAPTPAPTPLPPAETLAHAKGLTGEGASKESLGQAMDMLRTIAKDAKEYKEAQPLLDKTTKRWARLAAEELVLGPKPENSAWDGRVECADRYLRTALNDYDSSEYLEWSKVTQVDLKGEPYWAVKLKLRAKNAFGAYIVKDVIFFIRQNEVVQAIGL
jgi:hypothetical protein